MYVNFNERLLPAFNYLENLKYTLRYGDIIEGAIRNKKLIQETIDYFAEIEEYENCAELVKKLN
jgi:hypothetical protein